MLDLKKYNYELPEELIARRGAEPRDSSRLFVYDCATDTVTFDTFSSLAKYVSADDFFVFNDTKVVPARVTLTKETGGKVEILFLTNENRTAEGWWKAISDRKIVPGQKLYFDELHAIEVAGQDERIFFMKQLFDEPLVELLTRFGTTPIPKYIGTGGLAEQELRSRYQAIFAKNPASVAAPTASLHFTGAVLSDLEKKGAEHAYVTLNVGLGTFAPVTPNHIEARALHSETFEISEKSAQEISAAKRQGKNIIPVGTTAMRTIESAAAALAEGKGSSGETNIFIFPPYDFKMADKLITNFHLPESSLMCLVDALLQHKKAKRGIVELYKIAILNKFRFYSFGDAMFIK